MSLEIERINRVDKEIILIRNPKIGVGLMETLDEDMSFPHTTRPKNITHVYRSHNQCYDVWHINESTILLSYLIDRTTYKQPTMRATSVTIAAKENARKKAKDYLEQIAGGKLE